MDDIRQFLGNLEVELMVAQRNLLAQIDPLSSVLLPRSDRKKKIIQKINVQFKTNRIPIPHAKRILINNIETGFFLEVEKIMSLGDLSLEIARKSIRAMAVGPDVADSFVLGDESVFIDPPSSDSDLDPDEGRIFVSEEPQFDFTDTGTEGSLISGSSEVSGILEDFSEQIEEGHKPDITEAQEEKIMKQKAEDVLVERPVRSDEEVLTLFDEAIEQGSLSTEEIVGLSKKFNKIMEEKKDWERDSQTKILEKIEEVMQKNPENEDNPDNDKIFGIFSKMAETAKNTDFVFIPFVAQKSPEKEEIVAQKESLTPEDIGTKEQLEKDASGFGDVLSREFVFSDAKSIFRARSAIIRIQDASEDVFDEKDLRIVENIIKRNDKNIKAFDEKLSKVLFFDRETSRNLAFKNLKNLDPTFDLNPLEKSLRVFNATLGTLNALKRSKTKFEEKDIEKSAKKHNASILSLRAEITKTKQEIKSKFENKLKIDVEKNIDFNLAQTRVKKLSTEDELRILGLKDAKELVNNRRIFESVLEASKKLPEKHKDVISAKTNLDKSLSDAFGVKNEAIVYKTEWDQWRTLGDLGVDKTKDKMAVPRRQFTWGMKHSNLFRKFFKAKDGIKRENPDKFLIVVSWNGDGDIDQGLKDGDFQMSEKGNTGQKKTIIKDTIKDFLKNQRFFTENPAKGDEIGKMINEPEFHHLSHYTVKINGKLLRFRVFLESDRERLNKSIKNYKENEDKINKDFNEKWLTQRKGLEDSMRTHKIEILKFRRIVEMGLLKEQELIKQKKETEESIKAANEQLAERAKKMKEGSSKTTV